MGVHILKLCGIKLLVKNLLLRELVYRKGGRGWIFPVEVRIGQEALFLTRLIGSKF